MQASPHHHAESKTFPREHLLSNRDAEVESQTIGFPEGLPTFGVIRKSLAYVNEHCEAAFWLNLLTTQLDIQRYEFLSDFGQAGDAKVLAFQQIVRSFAYELADR
jgi:hypothetical protein